MLVQVLFQEVHCYWHSSDWAGMSTWHSMQSGEDLTWLITEYTVVCGHNTYRATSYHRPVLRAGVWLD